MDFIMNYRLLDCLRQGLTPDMTVYDAADWSSLLEISARSVKEGSMPVACPDSTRGGWKTMPPLAPSPMLLPKPPPAPPSSSAFSPSPT
jgi:hypothetical protein